MGKSPIGPIGTVMDSPQASKTPPAPRGGPSAPTGGAGGAGNFRLAPGRSLRLRWLGHRVAYRDAHAWQKALWSAGTGADDWLLLLEHSHVYTAGLRARPEHMLVAPESVGAELLRADRGGDITYHGPGQLVGYPVLSVPSGPGATPAYVHQLEQLVIDALAAVGLPGAGRLEGYPGVWVGTEGPAPRKICAIGARHSRQRTMHGFALNVAPDLGMFGHIVPCGIADKAVTSLVAEGVDVPMGEVVEAVFTLAEQRWGQGRPVERQYGAGLGGPKHEPEAAALSAAWPPPQGAFAPQPPSDRPVRLLGRLAQAGVDPNAGLGLSARKPEWLRARAHMGTEFRALRATVRSRSLATVCEEAGCPNIFECWADGTATFMINGDRCTRACGFCQVGTRKPLPLDPGEPARVAEAVAELGLAHTVVTCVARDDLEDGGAAAFASTIDAIRERAPGTAVEVLISDCKGDPASLGLIFDRQPDVLNHNVETVLRLQRAVRPSASYARSLGVLARAKAAGLVVKSGFMLGLGETEDEVLGLLADLAGTGVDIVTIGQYLRPSALHLPVARWWAPAEFDALAAAGRRVGIGHVVASPLTRSSYHARQAAAGPGDGGEREGGTQGAKVATVSGGLSGGAA